MEERIADIPALVPLLERLTALALPVVHMLDPMSVSNIFWALGTLRLNPAGQPHTIRARRPPQASPQYQHLLWLTPKQATSLPVSVHPDSYDLG